MTDNPIKGVVATNGDLKIEDESALESREIDGLVYTAVFGDEDSRDMRAG